MIKVQCDRCGVQETTSDTTVPAPAPLPVVRRVPLPDDWRRTEYPKDDGSVWHRHLCPPCVTALRRFYAGDVCVLCGHTSNHHDPLRGCDADGPDGETPCERGLSPADCLDPGRREDA